MMSIVRQVMTIAAIALTTTFADAQVTGTVAKHASAKAAKPYKILTSGKQVSVKSNKNITSIMVWTSNGHRIIEQREVNVTNYSFTISIRAKIIFVMIKLDDGQVYTEKIGLP
jgi:hypothetical protein